jgi:proteasome lid subunit RPN8/RPN11
MLEQARAELPNECVGLLAGRRQADVGVVVRHYPLVNALASPVEFESEARGMFQADRDMRANDLEILAIYHSHPTSKPVPSRKDLQRNYSPGVVNLIISLQTAKPAVRAWWLTEDGFAEADWQVCD